MRVEWVEGFCAEAFALAARAPEATFYHTHAWSAALVRAFARMRAGALLVRDGGDVVGAMPFVDVHVGPAVRRWSMPLGTYGGPLTEPGLDASAREAVRRALLDAFFRSRRGRVIDVGFVDFPGIGDVPGTRAVTSTTHMVALDADFDVVVRERFASDRRKRMRNARRLGVTVRRARSAADVDAFYRVYLGRVRELGGTPPHPRVLFDALLELGADGAVRLHVAEHEGRIVGGHCNFHFADTVIAWYGMVDAVGRRVQAGTLLYAECLREACEEGYRWYNLGSSAGRESLERYKESLGGVRREYVARLRRARWLVGARTLVHASRRWRGRRS